MKNFLLAALLFTGFTSFGQYYYKDIIGTKEISDLIATYRTNKVRSVIVNSYDGSNVRVQDFSIQQQFSPTTLSLTTVSKSATSDPSVLTSFVDATGKLVRTVDSSSIVVSKSTYQYDDDGKLISLTVSSIDTSKKFLESEQHIWQYKGNRIDKMLRVKNKVDTAVVEFKFDDNGNIVEEVPLRKGIKSEPVYYYYDESNRLTDIVRFNNKAKRLLPEYMFEYSPANQVIQRITVPASGSDYIIWRSQYDQRGLKTKEAIYNKYKELTGKIEYQYSFGS